jgi:small neutral amino acid transporter SnatA (MarC family)
MFEEYEKKKRNQVSLMRSLMDVGMGLIILFLGVFFFFRDKLNIGFNNRFPPDSIDKILGGIFMVYGAWRVYRGIKKNYFK